MKPEALAKKCAEAINSAVAAELPADKAVVMLVLPPRFKPPARFPRGKTAQWKADGSRIAYFNAMNVLAWLVAKGAVQVEFGTLQDFAK